MHYGRGLLLVVFDVEPGANNAIYFRGCGRLCGNMTNQQECGKRKHQRFFHFVHDLYAEHAICLGGGVFLAVDILAQTGTTGTKRVHIRPKGAKFERKKAADRREISFSKCFF
jgi:hypothetical protein